MNQFLPNYELIWKKNNIILFFSTEHFAASFPGKLKWKKKLIFTQGSTFRRNYSVKLEIQCFSRENFPIFHGIKRKATLEFVVLIKIKTKIKNSEKNKYNWGLPSKIEFSEMNWKKETYRGGERVEIWGAFWDKRNLLRVIWE